MSITKRFVSGLMEHFISKLNKFLCVCFAFARNKHLNLDQVDREFFPFLSSPNFNFSGIESLIVLKLCPQTVFALKLGLLLLLKHFVMLPLKAATAKYVLL